MEKKPGKMNRSISNGTIQNDELGSVMTGVFIGLSVLGVLIFAANGLVFLLVYKQRSLLRKTNYFLISLAVSDILSGLVGIPLVLVANSTFGKTIDEIPKAMDITNKFLAYSTILHLLTATIERYIKVLAPLHYRRLVTRKRILLVLAGIWMVSLTTPLIELTWSFEIEISKIYSLTLLFLFVVIPLLIMVFMTIHIFYLISQQKKRLRTLSNRTAVNRQLQRKRAQRRATIVYSSMSFSFAVNWFPYFFFAHLADAGSDISIPTWTHILFLFMKFSSGLIDPLLYTFFKTDFQAALKSLMFPRPKDNEVNVPMTLLMTNNEQGSSSGN